MQHFSLKVKVLSGVILAIIMMAALLLALPAQSGADEIECGYGFYCERVCLDCQFAYLD